MCVINVVEWIMKQRFVKKEIWGKRKFRCMVVAIWRSLFPDATVEHGFATNSDHKPIHLFLEKRLLRNRERKSFRFELMWLRDKSFTQVVLNAWNEGGLPNTRMKQKLRNCRDKITLWNENNFGNVR